MDATAWQDALTFIQNYGIGIVVMVAILFFSISFIRGVWMPALRRRSELKLAEEEERSKLEIQALKANAEYERAIRESQLKETHAKLELVETMVATSQSVTDIVRAVDRSLNEHTAILSEVTGQQHSISKAVSQLLEKHEGKQFETMTLKHFKQQQLDLEYQKNKWTEDEYKRLSAIIQRGL